MGVSDDYAQLLQAANELGRNLPAAGATDSYASALAEFAMPGRTAGERQWAKVQPYQESETGKIKYGNGVIVDQTTGELIVGPWMADPDVEGSNAWLNQIQTSWSQKDFSTWRKRLNDMGYGSVVSGGIATKGGVAADVIEGLRQFHYQRYLNYGKPLKMAPKQTAESIRKQVDFMTLKDEAKTWGELVFGEPLDEDSSEFFAQQVVRTATRLAKKHPEWTLGQALGTPGGPTTQATGAFARVQKKFVEIPGVKGELKQLEEDEMDESLREGIVSMMQLGST